jgi:ferric-dicitrate binding protein FerR (iron transport regulator)
VPDHQRLSEALHEIRRYRVGLIVFLNDKRARAPGSGAVFVGRLEQGLDTLAFGEGLRDTWLPYLTILQSDDRRFGLPPA